MNQTALDEQNAKIRRMCLEASVLQRKIAHLEYQIIQDIAVFNVGDYVNDSKGQAYMVIDRVARHNNIRSKNYKTSAVYVCLPAYPDGTLGTVKKIFSAKQITRNTEIQTPEF